MTIRGGVMPRPTSTAFALILVTLALACSSGAGKATGNDGGCPIGSETCACYGNGTCNQGLTCASTVCVNLGTAGSGGAGGNPGSGGSAPGAGGGGSSGGSVGVGGSAGSSGGTAGIGQAGAGGNAGATGAGGVGGRAGTGTGGAAGGSAAATCTATTACGTKGATYKQCMTSVGGKCQSSDYETSDGHVYACTACGDCTTALTEVESYCTSLPTTTATTTCTVAMACGPTGLTFKECYTEMGTTCLSGDFEMSDGTVFPCPQCNCTAATLTELQSYCKSVNGAGGVCQKAAPCDASGKVTFESCMQPTSSCESAFYRTSTGEIFPWASCTNHAVAADYLVQYCMSLGGVECGGDPAFCTSGQTCCACPGQGSVCMVLSAGATCETYGCQR